MSKPLNVNLAVKKYQKHTHLLKRLLLWYQPTNSILLHPPKNDSLTYRENIKPFKKKLESIQKHYTEILQNTEVYHNDAQHISSFLKTSWALISKMLNLGHSKEVISIAEDTFRLAVFSHEFNVAAEVSSSLSYHAGQYLADTEAYKHWKREYENYSDQHYLMQESKLKYAWFSLVIQNYKHSDDKVRTQINDLVKHLEGYKDHAESYIYWHCYYKARIFLHEINGHFGDVLKDAKAGYQYFDDLPLNHSDAKSGMLASIIHALNLMHRYEDGIEYRGMREKSGNTNDQLHALRLARSFINLGDFARAFRLLAQIKDHSQLGEKKKLYLMYCSGDHQGEPDSGPDAKAGHLIAELYCDHRAGKTERYTHQYVLRFVLENELLGTREGLIIEILSLFRFRVLDPETFNQIYDLQDVMRFAPCRSTESEVLRFETMIDELLAE